MDKEIMGIYMIKNVINDKVYIGQSVNIKRRISNHKSTLRNNICGNKHLQNSWNKYGEKNFIFLIKNKSNGYKNLTYLEQKYTNFYKSNNKKYGYNERIAVDTNLGRKYSKEMKEKISKIHKGKKISDEQKRVQSEFMKENKYSLGKYHTEETK